MDDRWQKIEALFQQAADVDRDQRDALLEHLFPVYSEKLLRNAWQESRDEAGCNLRPLRYGADELLQVPCEKLHIFAGPIFEHEGKSA